VQAVVMLQLEIQAHNKQLPATT